VDLNTCSIPCLHHEYANGVKLTERHFREYWERSAEYGSANERLRFKAVLDLMQADLMLSRSTVPKYCLWWL
jgi:hypothetical protein